MGKTAKTIKKEVTKSMEPNDLVLHTLKTFKSTQSIFYANYNVLDHGQGEISLNVSVTGMVTGGEGQYTLDGVVHEIGKDQTKIIGINNQLEGKRIKIVRSVSGEEGTPYMLTIRFKGGYKDAEYHLSSKVDDANIIAFTAYIDFI
jgi:hypothetical protein